MAPRKHRPAGDVGLVVGYIRASTEDQALSPAAQRHALEQWCDAHSARLIAVHEDLGVSGGAELDRRPGLLRALDALVEHGAGVLLVGKRDRLARDVMIAAMVERLAERNGARVLSADGAGNGEGPEAQLLKGVLDVLAQYERAMIRARTRAALAVKKSRGERVGSLPYGYRINGDPRHLVPHAAEQEVVALVRVLRAEGLTFRAIATELEQAGHTPRSGGSWHPQTVSRIAEAANDA